MNRLTQRAQQIVAAVVREGDVVIDATAGNGYDTAFLSRAVGPAGRVHAFDTQPAAIEASRLRIPLSNVAFHCADHATMAREIADCDHGRIAAVMFNLGYQPGGDKSITTRADSTVTAIRAALGLLRSRGVLTCIVYRGHPGGPEEAAAVAAMLAEIDASRFTCTTYEATRDDATSPILHVLDKQP